MKRKAVIRAYKDAIWHLKHKEPSDYTCCGIHLASDGTCQYRSYHPTPFHVDMWSYPEWYTKKGKYRGD